MDDGLDIPMTMAQAQLMKGTNGNEAGLLMSRIIDTIHKKQRSVYLITTHMMTTLFLTKEIGKHFRVSYMRKLD